MPKWSVLISPFLGLFLSSCFFEKMLPVPTFRPIKIGAAFDLSGDNQSFQESTSRGAILAVEEINNSTKLFGYPINFIVKDSGSDLIQKTQVADDLANHDAVDAFIGGADSQSVIAMDEVVEEVGIPFISFGATSPRLPKQMTSGAMLFLTGAGDNAQAALAAEFAKERFGSNALILHDEKNEDARFVARYFRKRFTELGGKILDTYYFVGERPRLAPVVRKIKKAKQNPDFVFIAGAPENVGSVISQLRDCIAKKPFLAWNNGEANLTNYYLTNVYLVTHSFLNTQSPSEKLKNFLENYKKKYDDVGDLRAAALGYDAVHLLVEGFKRADSRDLAKVMQALESIENFTGVTGDISFRGGSRTPSKLVTILKMGSSEPQVIEEKLPEKVPIP